MDDIEDGSGGCENDQISKYIREQEEFLKRLDNDRKKI